MEEIFARCQEQASKIFKDNPEELKNFKEKFLKVLSEVPEEFKQEFMQAPAAKMHHQNYATGLAEHSYKLGYKLYSRVLKIGGFSASETARVAICHDFCKLGLYHLVSEGVYSCDKEQYSHHGLCSLQRAEKIFKLSQAERICILLHMAGGWWNDEDQEYLSESDKRWIGENFRLLSAVQWADMEACH